MNTTGCPPIVRKDKGDLSEKIKTSWKTKFFNLPPIEEKKDNQILQPLSLRETTTSLSNWVRHEQLSENRFQQGYTYYSLRIDCDHGLAMH